MNKKGNILYLVMFFVLIMVVMILGLVIAFGSASINWVADQVVPQVTTLGNVGSLNLSSASQGVINPLNTFVQSSIWISGVLYFLMIVFCIAFPLVFRASPSTWLVGFFLVGMIMVIFMGIFVSNMYEEFYTSNDDVGSLLHEHTLLSFLVLQSPVIFTIVGFISGIIMFSGMQREEYL